MLAILFSVVAQCYLAKSYISETFLTPYVVHRRWTSA